jgi:serine/threonine protein phosphatase PrpC
LLSTQYAGAAENPFALVANCGDSRLLTDDGSGTTSFRPVTKDHRPSEPSELQRLKESQRDGRAYLARVGKRHTLRVFPGGLAMSRSIGDVGLSGAIIPTPDVFVLPLIDDDDDIDNSRPHGYSRGCTQRFVMASDGLWNYVSNETAGRLAARACVDGSPARSPKQAVSELMEHCLQHGGYHDDVTILVVDVTISS